MAELIAWTILFWSLKAFRKIGLTGDNTSLVQSWKWILTLLFYQCIDTSSNRKSILTINEKLLAEKSYTFQNFTFNTPKCWVLMNPKDSINLVFLSSIDSSMMLVNITNKFDPSLFSKPQYAAFINNKIKFQQKCLSKL